MKMFYTECKKCGIPLRQRGEKLSQFPGTQLVSSHGMCTRCYRSHHQIVGKIRDDSPVLDRPPRTLDPDEAAALRLLEKYGLADEMRDMLGFNETERPQPLTDTQMMKNSLTAPGGGSFDLFSDSDPVVRRALRTGAVRGRRL